VRQASTSAPFDLEGDDRGVLCIHGFTGAPEGLRYLGDRLAARGLAVHGVLLPGHGTRVEDLETVTWRDWIGHVETAFDLLAARCSRVAVVGQSMGGLLALHLATVRPTAAIAALATPLWLDGMGAKIARWTAPGGWLHGRIRFVPKIGGADVRARDARRGNYGYDHVPVRGLGELMALIADVEGRLDYVRAPVLIMHGRRDHTVPFACAATLAARTRAERVRALDRSYHLLASDVERDVVAAEVGTFFERHLQEARDASRHLDR
jgi:carboxylesterase